MLSKNEFVMTADAVRGMGGGNIEKGAQRLYDQMKTMRKESSIMAVTETRVLPPEFIEAAGKTYLGNLELQQVDIKQLIYQSIWSTICCWSRSITSTSSTLATQGIGAYQPFLQLQQLQTGPTAYQQFMSPYQQDVIDATLAEFDVQAQKGTKD